MEETKLSHPVEASKVSVGRNKMLVSSTVDLVQKFASRAFTKRKKNLSHSSSLCCLDKLAEDRQERNDKRYSFSDLGKQILYDEAETQCKIDRSNSSTTSTDTETEKNDFQRTRSFLPSVDLQDHDESFVTIGQQIHRNESGSSTIGLDIEDFLTGEPLYQNSQHSNTSEKYIPQFKPLTPGSYSRTRSTGEKASLDCTKLSVGSADTGGSVDIREWDWLVGEEKKKIPTQTTPKLGIKRMKKLNKRCVSSPAQLAPIRSEFGSSGDLKALGKFLGRDGNTPEEVRDEKKTIAQNTNVRRSNSTHALSTSVNLEDWDWLSGEGSQTPTRYSKQGTKKKKNIKSRCVSYPELEKLTEDVSEIKGGDGSSPCTSGDSQGFEGIIPTNPAKQSSKKKKQTSRCTSSSVVSSLINETSESNTKLRNLTNSNGSKAKTKEMENWLDEMEGFAKVMHGARDKDVLQIVLKQLGKN